MNECFIYVSQIPRGGSTGQNKFEKSFIKFLLKKGDDGKKYEIKIFSADMEGEKSDDDRVTLIPLSSKSYSGYIIHQLRQLFILGIFLWHQRKKKIFMFVRYHDAMIAPLILAFLFNIRLTMRSGPVLPGLALCSKNPGAIIFHSIKWVLGLFYKKASSIITVTENIKKGILEAYKLNPEKIIVIPNAVDTELFFPEHSDRKKWKLPKDEFVFGFVGTIDDSQGVETIIQAFGFLKKNQEKVPLLFIVGDGEYRPTLEAMAKKLEVTDSLIWAGNIPHNQVRSAINACDMMLAPVSITDLKWRGSSSLKLWEYLACDKPILATEFEDFQFLENFNLGKMVEADNIESWAESMALEAKRKNMFLQGRGEKFVAEKHSYNLVVEKLLSISFGQNVSQQTD
jgi:glycosyltransferase involved in cell wall biosynthesis